MRICSITLLLFATAMIGAEGSVAQSSDCDVEKILEVQDVPDGTLAVSGYGSTTEVTRLLVPISLEKGKYEVTVSHKSDNLYLVEGENLYLKTEMCLEMASMSDAVLEVASSEYGYGTLYFLK